MTSKPVTPSQREAPTDLDSSKIDQSDDDSDTKEELRKRYGSLDMSQDKSHDQDAHYTVEANSDYSLFTNPPDLGTIRQQLFDIPGGLEMSDTDFELYFPFIDNIWRKNRLPEAQKDSEGTSEIYCCRLKPTGQVKTPTPKPAVEGKQQRRKRKREDKTCPMTMKVTYVEGPTRKVKISKIEGQETSHSHDLDYMDANKRNSAVMDVARREAHRGFLPGSIFWKMQEEPDKMNEAGGKFMKVSDVRNVQYPWRQLNPTVILKAHSGYSQQRTGPRQRPATGSAPSTPKNGEAKPTKPLEHFHPIPVPQSLPRTQPPAVPPPLPPSAPQSTLPHDALHFPEQAREFLTPYLPNRAQVASQQRPHVTLTWATSLDARIALMPGVQTAISGPETKAMTHYLRSHHDAILIGVKTAITDDPRLNCRLAGAKGYGGPPRALASMQPRPIIIDPHARLHIHPEMRLLKAVAEGKAVGPWIVVGPNTQIHPVAVTTLKQFGGEFLKVNEIHPEYGLDWNDLFGIFYREGIKSIMIEGGAKVLSELLNPRHTHMVDSVIVTVAPTFFGRGGAEVSPETTFSGQQPIQTRLQNVKWQPMGVSDVVLCGYLDKPHLQPRPSESRLPGINEIARQHGPPLAALPPAAHAPSVPLPHPQHHAQPAAHGPPPPIHHAPPNNLGQAPPPQHPPPHPHGPGQPSQPYHGPPNNSSHLTHARHPSQPQTNGTTPNVPNQRSPQFRQYGPPPPARPT